MVLKTIVFRLPEPATFFMPTNWSLRTKINRNSNYCKRAMWQV